MNQGPSKFQIRERTEWLPFFFFFFFFSLFSRVALEYFPGTYIKKKKKKKVTHILVLSQPLYKYIDYSSVTYVPNKSTY